MFPLHGMNPEAVLGVAPIEDNMGHAPVEVGPKGQGIASARASALLETELHVMFVWYCIPALLLHLFMLRCAGV